MICMCVRADPKNVEDGIVEFNSNFLRGSNGTDLSRFEEGSSVTPGDYRLDIFVNESFVGRQDVKLTTDKNSRLAEICFKETAAKQLGLDVAKLPNQELVENVLKSGCVDFRLLNAELKVNVDMAAMSASLVIPSAYLGRIVRGYIDPKDWEEGVNAGFLDYGFNAYRTSLSGEGTSNRFFAGLNSGVNINGWRVRHSGSYNKDEESSQGDSYDAINTYAQHDITSLRAQATIGEYFTPGDSFDSMPFTGLQFASDERMLPESQRGFAPEIRGTAETNAQVTVLQQGNVIYKTTVAPGAFLIDDLYSTGYAGDLDVVVTEADGREKRYTVPYASVNQLLRPGASRFSLTMGQYRDEFLGDVPNFAQATYRRGVTNDITIYTGGIVAEKYLSALSGAAFSTPYGAVAADITYSRAADISTEGDDAGTMAGQSYRLSYSNVLDYTRTNFAIAAYRFSSEEYLSFGDFAQLAGSDEGENNIFRERNRFQVNISQPVRDFGSVYMSGIREDYWDRNENSTTYQAGFSRSLGWGSLSVSASRTKDDEEGYSTEYFVTLSIPLDFGSPSAHLSTSLNYEDGSNNSLQTSLSGVGGDHDEFDYNLYSGTSLSNEERTNAYGGSLNYTSPAVITGLGVSQSSEYKQWSASVRGTAVADYDGFVFTSSQGETMAIIEAKGAEGAEVGYSKKNRLDSEGRAVVVGLTPYRSNEIRIDPKGTSEDVELKYNSQSVAPRHGAIVKLEYETVTGKPVLLRVQSKNGSIPFGADVLDRQGNSVAMVGQHGLVYLRETEETNYLTVRWGGLSEESCYITVPEIDLEQYDGFQQIPVECLAKVRGEHG